MTEEIEFSSLIGKTLIECVNENNERIVFKTEKESFTLYHEADCCESVTVDDICGELSDLVGSVILQAEENSSKYGEPKPDECAESWKWTFYRIATIKGAVTIKWLGQTNGYYSESVSFSKL